MLNHIQPTNLLASEDLKGKGKTKKQGCANRIGKDLHDCPIMKTDITVNQSNNSSQLIDQLTANIL